MERGSHISHCLIVLRLMTYDGGRTKTTGSTRLSRRYSGWIMCGDRRLHRHLPERVLRQYGYVQTIPRPLTDVAEMSAAEIAQAFLDFCTRTLKAADWGEHAGEDSWRMADGYVRWYTVVSHPQILPLLPGDIPRPPNEEQIIAE